ncbi:MAG TPA: iron ABC transporter permease [Anaerolineae bacterium]|nr:iron ABC transporter permease [Anaerolineae bacterium]HPL30367.1 iron ABC transporter permease [Anaerolineae bacterium]
MILLLLSTLGLAFISLFWGRYPIPLWTVLRVLASRLVPIPVDWLDTVETVIFNVRLPRIVLAMCVGASLSISGAAFQGMFHNPLVSPDILGVTAGAGFGAALAILLSGSGLAIQLSALFFGILAVALSYVISRIYRTTPTLMLVLSGIIVGSIFSALLSLAKYAADPNQKLPAIVFWLMGSLTTVVTEDILMAGPPIVLGVLGLLLIRWRINVLSMGDEEARALGVKTELLKGIIVVCATAATASAVSVCGIIGWVGLVVPHVGRMLVGPDHKVLLPASLLLGAFYLLLIDNLARTLTSAEIPLSILTALVGAPFFAYMLRRTQGGRV